MKEKLNEIIFGTHTKAGRVFDQFLLVVILCSVFVTVVDSVPRWNREYHHLFIKLEWFFTFLFLIEYLIRIYISRNRWRYVLSFWGLIDLLALIPTLISPLFTGFEALLIIRSLRLLRLFRVLKLSRFSVESNLLYHSLRASSYKITVFLFFVLMFTIFCGALMYVVEGPENGFDSIPQGVYWSIVTLTTVGYGDISPVTALGKIIASLMMITGYGIIAIPTGLITVEMSKFKGKRLQHCSECDAENGEHAKFCDQCGSAIEAEN